jgi:aldehyde:ferredoxin oxidoreductase
MFGWTGTILRIDLTRRKVTREATDPQHARMYIGARGLGTKFMYDEVDPRVDPLSPGNKLLFASGPFSGTHVPSAGRYDLITKGPLTGAIAASNCGGTFGAELKQAGYDMLIVEGRAEKPVYVWIKDDQVEIRDAGHVWGQSVPDTTRMIQAETHENAKLACIGPAGEKLVLFACVMNEMHRAAGRSGVGAVMGSKHLKAIAVVGTGRVKVADAEAFASAVLKARQRIQVHPIGGEALKAYGTNVLMNVINEVGGLPTRNHRDAHFPNADKVGGEALSAKYLLRPKACTSCSISCGRFTRVTNPKYAGEGEGPEYETSWALGPECGIDDLDAITKANYLCNELGMDTISMGVTIACAMDMYQAGILTFEDTDGLPLNFGNAEAMVEMVRKTGLRQGFGDKLALGSYRLAEGYGHPEYSMSVKKQEPAAYDPRAIQGIGLEYATSNRGACHVRGYTIASEVLGNPTKVDQHITQGKAELAITFQNLTAALDSSGACLFATFGIGQDELAEMLSALTGVLYSTEEFLKVGERIWNLERLWNLKAGFTAKDDTLPQRLLKEPIQSGPSKGKVNRLDQMLPEYYKLRGWDGDGIPGQEKLQELSLV